MSFTPMSRFKTRASYILLLEVSHVLVTHPGISSAISKVVLRGFALVSFQDSLEALELVMTVDDTLFKDYNVR